ncbi:MAG: Holliday junction resolvase RuvX [Deltaproteobacteria bacterium]|nr:Holliday junction resolvase RuvX [Deltaproteobacteria bacterium]
MLILDRNLNVPGGIIIQTARVLALDVGEKRVGVAVSDPLGLTAQPLMVLPRRPHGVFLEKMAELRQTYQPAFVVVGLPRRTDGRLGPEAQKAMALAHELKSRLDLRVTTWEEWMTTAEAERLLKSDGLNSQKRREVIDKTAATLILEGYLHRYGPRLPELS